MWGGTREKNPRNERGQEQTKGKKKGDEKKKGVNDSKNGKKKLEKEKKRKTVRGCNEKNMALAEKTSKQEKDARNN